MLLENCRLRPLEKNDVETARVWRNEERIRAVMFSDEIISQENQEQWFEGLATDSSRIYFVFEINKQPAGMVYFNPIKERTGIWGFYRGMEPAPKGCGLTMGYLGLETAFEKLDLLAVKAETFEFNTAALGLQKKLGFSQDGFSERVKAGVVQKVIHLSIKKDEWEKRKKAL